MKKAICFILAFVLLSSYAQSFSEKINAAVEAFVKDTDLNAAWIGICVKDLRNNQLIVDYNAKKNFVPASLQKIPLSITAIENLGMNYTFKTYLLSTGTIENHVLNGNLYIKGGGDPSLGSVRFAQTHPDTILNRWVQAIQAKGIERINGNIYIDAGIFDPYPQHDSWMWGDIGNYYGAGIKGLSWHENMFVITLQAADSVGKKNSILSIYPPLPPHYVIDNQSISIRKGSESYISVYGDAYAEFRQIRGGMALDKKNMTVKAALPLPEYVCAWSFKNYLQKEGILIGDTIYNIQMDTLTIQSDTLYMHASPPLLSLLHQINKNSNNVYAEAVLKCLGKGFYANGIATIKAKLKSIGLTIENINIADGSGLSTINFISPLALCDLLSYVATKNYYPPFIETLSEAGASGTLRHMLKQKPKDSHLYAKSGSMSGVRAYAGYVLHSNGNSYCFTIIVNHFTCESSLVKTKIEHLMLSLIE